MVVIFIEDNRKIMALYNVYASAEVDLARREKTIVTWFPRSLFISF